MQTRAVIGDTLFDIDPARYYVKEHAQEFGMSAVESAHYCVEACGLLPSMLVSGDGGLVKNLEDNYIFFTGWRQLDDKATLEDGVWKYYGDDDLYPFVSVSDDAHTVRVYPYGIVVIENNQTKSVHWTRAD